VCRVSGLPPPQVMEEWQLCDLPEKGEVHGIILRNDHSLVYEKREKTRKGSTTRSVFFTIHL